jgi:EAL and modified HD-GYP domain-containing signal transduction protein
MGKISPLFARQPIFDRQLEVIAYELLFRSNDATDITKFDGDHASSHVIYYAFAEQNVTDVIGSRQAFINFTRNLLVSPPPLPPTQLVIEVLENVQADQAVIEGLRHLKAAGYQIALDDFFLTKNTRALLEFATIVKIDVLALSDEEVQTHIDFLQSYDVKLLAEKVETYEMLERCKEQGFHYFQGYFLSRPQVIEGVKITDNKSAILELLGTLANPMADFDDVVETIAKDPQLSYKVLKLVNSASVGLKREINSLSHAVAMLGLTQIRNWAIFLLLTSSDEKPRELCALSLTRAKWCEILGTRLYGRALGEMGFTTGLLSNLDAFLDMPMDQLVARLHFAEQVRSALTEHRGKLGSILQLAILHEQGRWQDMDWTFLKEHELSEEELNKTYTSAVTWAEHMLQSV